MDVNQQLPRPKVADLEKIIVTASILADELIKGGIAEADCDFSLNFSFNRGPHGLEMRGFRLSIADAPN